jgi:argininosuccinate lyase
VIEYTRGEVDSLFLMKCTPLTCNRDFQEDKRLFWHTFSVIQGMLDVISDLSGEDIMTL